MTISNRPPEPPESPGCSFNSARTDALREFLGNARFRGLLAMLVAECRERPAKWRDMHRRGDVAALRAEGHALAVAAASVGASRWATPPASSNGSRCSPGPRL